MPSASPGSPNPRLAQVAVHPRHALVLGRLPVATRQTRLLNDPDDEHADNKKAAYPGGAINDIHAVPALYVPRRPRPSMRSI